MRNQKSQSALCFVLIVCFIWMFCTAVVLVQMPGSPNSIHVLGINRAQWGSLHGKAGFIFLLLVLSPCHIQK